MRSLMNNKKCMIICMAAVLLIASIVPVRFALAYFTDFQEAAGSGTVDLSWSTEPHEVIEHQQDKAITIENTGETDVIVRVRVFAGDFAEVTDHTDWTESGDWWYYNKILAPGEESSVLRVVVNSDEVPAEDFNIIVVHESSRVAYESNTKVMAPNDQWTLTPTL